MESFVASFTHRHKLSLPSIRITQTKRKIWTIFEMFHMMHDEGFLRRPTQYALIVIHPADAVRKFFPFL